MILPIGFLYNEAEYLQDIIDYWRSQGLDPYFIDNESKDRSQKILSENDIEYHLCDTNETFHLSQLQREVEDTLKNLNPDWVIKADADLYYFLHKPIKDVIMEAERLGYNQIAVDLWSAFGNERPLTRNYMMMKSYPLVIISRYDRHSFTLRGDTITIDNGSAMNVPGMVVNYGACKNESEREEKLARRKRAWDAGLSSAYGQHFLQRKAVNWTIPDGLYDVSGLPEINYIARNL